MLQATYALVHSAGLLPKLSDIELFSVLVAAAAHGPCIFTRALLPALTAGCAQTLGTRAATTSS